MAVRKHPARPENTDKEDMLGPAAYESDMQKSTSSTVFVSFYIDLLKSSTPVDFEYVVEGPMKKRAPSTAILILIALGALTGISSWTEFKNSDRKPMLYLDQVSNATKEGVRYPQSVEIVTNLENKIEPGLDQDVISLQVTHKLPVGFTFSEIRVTLPNATRASYKPFETSQGFQRDLRVTVKPSEKIVILSVLRSSLDSCTGNLTTVVTATYRYPGIFGIGAEDRTLTQSASTVIRVPFEALYSVLRDIKDQSWLSYVLANNLCIEDGKLTDQEVTYLKHPTPENADRLLKSYLSAMSQIPEIGPQLAREFPKIPDFRPNNDTVEALEDIVSIALRSTKDELKVLDLMLKEGISEMRKYCSTLQALLWCCEGLELVGQDLLSVVGYYGYAIEARIYSFVDSVWKGTYGTSKWESFQVVVDRLNSPELVAIYIRNNFRYQIWPYTTEQVPPKAWRTFEKRGGQCGDYAIFGAYCLAANGYDACVLGVFPYLDKGDGGHAVTLFKNPNAQLFFIYDYTGPGSAGPFNSIEEAAGVVYHIPLSLPWRRYILWDINWRQIKEVAR